MSNQLAIREDMQTADIAAHFVRSGYFSDVRDVSQAVVKILAGREFGFGAFASMNGVYIIQGRPALGANLMAAAVKRSGRYDYRVREMTGLVCTIEYFERDQHGNRERLGTSTFSLEDARKAGTKNLDKFARNMLFARAMSNGVRWYCPDVFNGSTVYVPEELGATVNEDGAVVDVPVIEAPSNSNSNPDEIANDAAWVEWHKLTKRASDLQIEYYEPEQGCTVEELRQAYKELKQLIHDTEAVINEQANG